MPTLILAHAYSPLHSLLFGVLTAVSWALAVVHILKIMFLGELVAASAALIGITGLASRLGLLVSLTPAGASALVGVQIVFALITMVVGPFVVGR